MYLVMVYKSIIWLSLLTFEQPWTLAKFVGPNSFSCKFMECKLNNTPKTPLEKKHFSFIKQLLIQKSTIFYLHSPTTFPDKHDLHMNHLLSPSLSLILQKEFARTKWTFITILKKFKFENYGGIFLPSLVR